jgi:preprotein translocase SecE subunit
MASFAPITFIRTAIEESGKVVWPTRQVITRHTLMVVVSVAIAALVFAGVDYGLQKLVIFSIQ